MANIKRTTYKGYVIDTDNLNRLYIYNTASPYSEDSDHIIVNARTVSEARAIIDIRIAEQEALR